MVKSALLFLLVFLGGHNVCYSTDSTFNVGVFDENNVYLETSVPYRIGWQIFIKASKKANLKIVVHPGAWTRSLKALKSNDLDALYGAMKTEERQAWAYFSLPVSYDTIQIFSEPNNPISVVSQIDKKSQTVGVTKDSIQHGMAKALNFSNIYPIVERDSLYKMLLAGRLDYIIFSNSLTNVYCYKYTLKGVGCLKAIGEPLAENSMHIMYSQSNQSVYEKRTKIDKQIHLMYQSGEIKNIFGQYRDGKSMYSTWRRFYLADIDAGQ